MTTPIVALDVSSTPEAMALVHRLDRMCGFYKIGSELFTAVGPAAVAEVRAAGAQVFLDLKYHDTPNTVRKAVASAAVLGASLVTVHAAGGRAMLEAAVAGANGRLGVLAVTVLTSLDAVGLAAAWGRPGVDVRDEVLRLAEVAQSAGVHGLVCSGAEVAAIRSRLGDRLALLVPGVRLPGDDAQDQARVVTPGDAAAAGARYVVLGRTVTAASDPRAAMGAALRAMAVKH